MLLALALFLAVPESDAAAAHALRLTADTLVESDPTAAIVAREQAIRMSPARTAFDRADDAAVIALARLRSGDPRSIEIFNASVSEAQKVARTENHERLALLLSLQLVESGAAFAPMEIASRRAEIERLLASHDHLGLDGARALANVADRLIVAGDAERALAFSRRAVAILSTATGAGSVLIDALGVAGDAELRFGSAPAAVELFQRAVTLADIVGVPATIRARTLQNLGRYYGDISRADLALPLFSRAVAALENLHPEAVSDIHFDAAQVAFASDVNETALQEAMSAVGSARRLAGPTSSLRRALALLARVQQDQRDYVAASQTIEEAIAVYRQTLAADDPRQGEALAVAALIYDAKGDAGLAVARCDAALKAMSSFRPTHRTLLSTRVYCARFHLKTADYSVAAQLSRAASNAQIELMIGQARQAGAGTSNYAGTVFEAALDSAWAASHASR